MARIGKNVITVSGLEGGYGSVQIINGIDLKLKEKEIVTIIGPNGSGKSTFIKVLYGLATYYQGQVDLRGEDISGMRTDNIVKRGVAYVPQRNNIFPTLSIRENLQMGTFLEPGSFEDNLERVLNIFEDLRPRLNERANVLSGGQRQMLALSRALMSDPSILLLDEPTAALSPILVQMILDKVEDLRDNAGVSIILVEQNAKSALKRSDYGYLFASGNVVHHQEADGILKDDKINEYFLGAST